MKFEEQYRQLEEILVRLERGELSLDESLQEYEKGIAALRACREVLARAERRIEELSATPSSEAARA
ncbi:MAG: exodeoxyribonuclease VII small subunit [Planctomycetes bacterium]|nr:exodeoxyribonuclease VII small subunit [Planctomycetota bacterium]